MLASRYVELCLILASFISLIMNSAASRQPVQINPVGFFSSQAYNLYGDPKADWVPDKRNSFAYIISPISRQLIEISRQSENKPQSELSATLDPVRDAPLLDLRNGSCSTVENKVMLERDELSSTTNQLIRTCRGYVKVKQCDGSCYSSVAPSALTHTGIKFVSNIRRYPNVSLIRFEV